MQNNVLLLSQRRISKLVAYCVGYEFEDIVTAVTGAERIETTDFPAIEFSRRAYKLARIVGRSHGLASRLAPSPRNKVMLDRDFSLFFPVFNHTFELYALAAVPNWRDRSKKAACYITEIWSDLLPEYLIELLSGFDHIFLGCKNSVHEVARITGRPCTYLPVGVDVVRFAPGSVDQPRPIDVSYIGRRSQVTHQALLDEMERRQFFYYYDTVAASGSDLTDRTFRVDCPSEHRRLLSAVLKHSRYFIANHSYINRPEFLAGRNEISPRFFEGAASGAVMLGEAPHSDEFKKEFDWPDAVVSVPFDSPNAGQILAELDADAERLRTIRTNNVSNAALRHDWLHRIQVIFDALGLPHTDQMRERAQVLGRIAAQAAEC